MELSIAVYDISSVSFILLVPLQALIIVCLAIKFTCVLFAIMIAVFYKNIALPFLCTL